VSIHCDRGRSLVRRRDGRDQRARRVFTAEEAERFGAGSWGPAAHAAPRGRGRRAAARGTRRGSRRRHSLRERRLRAVRRVSDASGCCRFSASCDSTRSTSRSFASGSAPGRARRGGRAVAQDGQQRADGSLRVSRPGPASRNARGQPVRAHAAQPRDPLAARENPLVAQLGVDARPPQADAAEVIGLGDQRTWAKSGKERTYRAVLGSSGAGWACVSLAAEARASGIPSYATRVTLGCGRGAPITIRTAPG
jgi:hypothetical protein